MSRGRKTIASLFALAALLLLPLVPATGVGVHAAGTIAPNPANQLDCNAYSPVYQSTFPTGKALCTDPRKVDTEGEPYPFTDNGHYIGHDEPSIKFISSVPGSANHFTTYITLPKDPVQTPSTKKGFSVTTWYAELSLAPWIGLPLCDPGSYPQNPCTPDSDTNTGSGLPTDAGSAFLESQFYPPGFTPFIDNASCSTTQWCASLHINSLECTYGFAFCNGNCIETTNFAFIQTNGVPPGPAGPQLANVYTDTPNANTLMMNPGDKLQVTLQDTTNGLQETINDLTTGKSGFMVASAANGYTTTNINDCSGTPFNFHPEYSTASQQNGVPWAALEGGVLVQNELGHFEPCSSVSSSFPVNFSFPDGSSFSDPNVYQVCNGGFEPGNGEGPCDVFGNCTGATTQYSYPCNAGAIGFFQCEYSDALCFPAGTRPVTINGVSQLASGPIPACLQDWFQNGDLDYDGTSYYPDWPDGKTNHPTPFYFTGPIDPNGGKYPTIQFESDGPQSENLCDFFTGDGCVLPPAGAAFYPFWNEAISHQGGAGCSWFLGNDVLGQTINDFGKDAQYGKPDLNHDPGTLISGPQPNPAANGTC